MTGLLMLAALASGGVTPRAHLVAGAIVRDAETLRAIAATREVRLPKDAGLELLVTKSRYRLDVTRGAELVKTFPVALGRRPEGPKTRTSDGRTPEGRYVLIPHHPSPGFGACFYIGYPNQDDARRALRERRITEPALLRITAALGRGDRPPEATLLGGLILLHGTRQRSVPGLTLTNWTTGCVAMENADVEELLSVFSRKDRPVLTIRP